MATNSANTNLKRRDPPKMLSDLLTRLIHSTKHTPGKDVTRMTGQKMRIRILSKLGHSINYDKFREIETAQAELVQQIRNKDHPLPKVTIAPKKEPLKLKTAIAVILTLQEQSKAFAKKEVLIVFINHILRVAIVAAEAGYLYLRHATPGEERVVEGYRESKPGAKVCKFVQFDSVYGSLSDLWEPFEVVAPDEFLCEEGHVRLTSCKEELALKVAVAVVEVMSKAGVCGCFYVRDYVSSVPEA
eukprot:gene13050-14393_t